MNLSEQLLALYFFFFFFPPRYRDFLDSILSDFRISCYASVVKMSILTQVRTVFSLRYCSLAFPNHMKGSLICGYILWKNSSVENEKPVAFRITCVQICIHILNTDKLEFRSFKEKKQYLSLNDIRFFFLWKKKSETFFKMDRLRRNS